MKLNSLVKTLLLGLATALLGALVALEAVRLKEAHTLAVSGGAAARSSLLSPAQASVRASVRASSPRERLWNSADQMRRMQQDIDLMFQNAFAQFNSGWPSELATSRHRDEPAPGGRPLDQIRQMRQHIDAMFQRASDDVEHFGVPMGFDEGWDTLVAVPGMDVRDGESNYVVTVSLPEVSRPNVRITLDGRLLTILAEQRSSESRPGAHGASPETAQTLSRFERRVQLPGPVASVQHCQAAWTQGMLRILLPKASNKESLENQIQIQ